LRNEFLRRSPKSGNEAHLFAWVTKLGAFLVIFLGLWVSTQRFARLMRYRPEYVGYPQYVLFKKYPLYAPYKYLDWLVSYFAKPGYRDFLYQAGKPWAVISAVAVIAYYFCDYLHKSKGFYGTARWAKTRELKREGLLSGRGGVVYGQLASARITYKMNLDTGAIAFTQKRAARLIMSVGLTNTLLAAPTRSGKGISSVIPTLLSYVNSVIVLDFKGENFAITSGYRATLGRVYRFSPMGESGHHFNPLMEIRGGKDTYADANMLADILTTPMAGRAGSDANTEHFTQTAKTLLTGAILHCLCSGWADKSLPGVKKFLSQKNPQDAQDDTFIYQQMINGVHCSEDIHERVESAAVEQIRRPDRERGSVLSSVMKAHALFEDTRVAENTADSDFSLSDFETTDKPISLYITVPNNERDRLAPLMRMLINILINRFSAGETEHNKKKMKVPVLFVLDEFDKLGKYNELQTNMGILAGYGLHFFLIIQSPSQLIDIYGVNHQFFAHCNNVLLYAPGEIGSAELCSRIIGKESIWKPNSETTGGKVKVSGSEAERNLINADEVMKLPKDQLIILTQGLASYIGKKCVFYNDERFKGRLYPPAFERYEDALRQSAGSYAREKVKWFEVKEEAFSDTERELCLDAPKMAENDFFGTAEALVEETPTLFQGEEIGLPK
jgi:type IV secretion system protein VirD4